MHVRAETLCIGEMYPFFWFCAHMLESIDLFLNSILRHIILYT
jgi:hypothetical protein